MKLVVCAVMAVVPGVAQTPVAYWPFDDGAGTKAIDASGHGHTATLANGMSWAPGKVGGGVSASAGSRQYIGIPAVNLSSTHAVTVALWAKRSYSTTGGHALFEATTDFTQSTTGFGFFPDDSACLGIQAAIKGDVGETANCYHQPTSGVWHHLAIVYDKTQTGGNQVAFYVDGVLQSPSRSLYASTNTNYFGNNPIYLFSQGGTQMFDSGRVDDVRLYASALTAAQIQQIYKFGKTQIGEDIVVSVDGSGTMTTPSLTTSVNGELLVAFVASDGPASPGQTATVSGGGLAWTLRQRSNHQWGTAEIWAATAPSAPFTTTVTMQPGSGGGYHGSLTVIGFTNASGTGKVGQASSPSGAPDIALASISAGNWVFAVGNDWDNPIARTPVSGQVLVHQRVDTQVGDTYWVQSTAAPSTTNGTADIHDSAPTSDQWNYAAVEIVSSYHTTQGTLTPSPASVSFGNVNVNTSASQTVTITNTGGASVTVSGVTISGTGFTLSAVTTPFILASGGTKQLTATFSPKARGAVSGSISIASNASNPNLAIPLSGTGTTPGTLTASPASLSFGNVVVNSSASQTVTITNSGSGPVTVSAVSISGSRFTLAAVTTPFILAAGGSKQLTATFAPTVTGAASGTITVTSNATNPSLAIPLSGTGTTPGTLSASPTSLNFGSVNVSSSASLTVTIKNTASGSVTVSAVSISGSGFTPAAVTTPFTLATGGSKQLTATFAPTVAGAASGYITVTSNASNPSLGISLSGTGVAVTGTLTASPASVSFGNVNVSSSASQTVTITNSGSGSVTVSGVTITGSGFTLAAVTTPFTLAAGGSKRLTVTFAPTVAGAASGYITVTSNASNPSLGISLSGTGVATTPHSVTLSWTASTSTVAGYNAYRSTNTSGPFTKLNTGLITSTTYVDASVVAGTTYYYYATSVDKQGNESAPSNEVSAMVP